MSLWTSFKLLFSGASSERRPKYQKLQNFDLDRLQNILRYKFADLDILQLGLTHRSHVRSHNGQMPSNERLEFLGDSVLGLVIAEQLFRDNPDLSEGDLTKQKAMLVNETALSRVAIEIGLHEYIYLSAEEETSGGRERPSIVSDTFEAVIAAVYLDGGLEAARRVILASIYSRCAELLNDTSQLNYKGELLELVQGQGNHVPQYDVVLESGPDHNKTFHVVVSIDGERFGEGKGTSKKEAEQKAARLALEKLSNTPR